MDEQPPVTVVIPALNAEGTLADQLEALASQDHRTPFEVIVVDNASTDGTRDLVRRYNPRGYELRLVTEPRRGINHARNAGIAASRDGKILLCDADDIAHPGWVAALVDALEPGCWVGGALDYMRLNDNQTREMWDVGERSGFAETCPYVDNTYGCNCGFWKSMWEEVGRFDSRLSGTGGDENEFFMRAFGDGYRPRHVPRALISYRLRPGARLFLRQRYRQGRNQVAMRKLPGGRLLPQQFNIEWVLRRLFRTIAVAPKHLSSRRLRFLWLGSLSRHLGRLSALLWSTGTRPRARRNAARHESIEPNPIRT